MNPRIFPLHSINAICSDLGEARSRALPVFLAMEKVKNQFGQPMKTLLTHLCILPITFLSICMQMYDSTSCLSSVNKKEKNLHQKSLCGQNTTHTRCTASKHTGRALYLAEIWTRCTQAQPTVPSPEESGWTMESRHWVLVWITLPQVSKACIEPIKCSCKGNCTRCRCVKANLTCNYSPLCTCKCNGNTNFMGSQIVTIMLWECQASLLGLFNTYNVIKLLITVASFVIQ